MRPEGYARFACPECGAIETLFPETPVRASTPVRISYRCTCGVKHAVFLYTRAARVEIDAFGSLISRHSDIKIAARVRNVSRSGMLLEFHEAPTLETGDELVVKFTLGGPSAVFFKSIEVRRINRYFVGAEFTRNEQRSPDRDFETALTHIVLET